MINKNKIKIILVEDDENDSQFIKLCLKKFVEPENLFHFENGADILDFIFKKGKFINRAEDALPNLILLDLKTPKVTGLEVLQKLKTDETTKSIPVVIITSSNEEKDLKHSYQYGANSFIVKPIDYETFARTIESVGQYWINVNQL